MVSIPIQTLSADKTGNGEQLQVTHLYTKYITYLTYNYDITFLILFVSFVLKFHVHSTENNFCSFLSCMIDNFTIGMSLHVPTVPIYVLLTVRRTIFTTSVLGKRIYRYPKLISNEVLQHPHEEIGDEDELLNSLKSKLVYNSLVSLKNHQTRWRIRHESIKKTMQQRAASAVPLSLKYVYSDSQLNFDEYRTAHIMGSDDSKCDVVPSKTENRSDSVNFPYSIVKNVEIFSDVPAAKNMKNKATSKCRFGEDLNPVRSNKIWMSDYEVYEEDYEDEINSDVSEYGTADPNVFPSKIPCGGCGANLHCQSSSIPGFLPKEIFLRCSEKDLKLVVCQRCTFLKNYGVALSVNVDPKFYPQLLSSIKMKDALVIILVDMLDFPCSIWPNMLNIIGRDKPVILVGNKVDLLPGDSPGWLEHAKKVLLKSSPATANILHVALISAKTGFGVETLITKIQSLWQTHGDVYLIGCTNVGKSSLFNDLLQSDFCRAEAVDLIQRATVAPWPGTTLNLLKFPILKMDSWRIFQRNSRLKQEMKMKIEEKKLERIQARVENKKISRLPEIIGLIGMTFKKNNDLSRIDKDDQFIMPTITTKLLNEDNRQVFDPSAPNFKFSKWCFDTPGVIRQDQIINILTTEELMKTLPRKIIRPRVYSIYLNQSILIGGLARIDLVECEAKMARLIVYASDQLPITVCFTEFVDEVYNTLLGSKYFAVPCGDSNRLQKWPPLKTTRDYEFTGKGNVTCVADIVLSSAGWVSPVAAANVKFVVRPFTPDARGIYLRNPPLLRYTAKFRKRRISNTPTYFMSHA